MNRREQFYGCTKTHYLLLQAVKNKDKIITELRGQIVEMEGKVAEANERERTAEGKMEELRRELRETEAVLQSNQDEMTALHEQLTEVCVCACVCVCVCLCVCELISDNQVPVGNTESVGRDWGIWCAGSGNRLLYFSTGEFSHDFALSRAIGNALFC